MDRDRYGESCDFSLKLSIQLFYDIIIAQQVIESPHKILKYLFSAQGISTPKNITSAYNQFLYSQSPVLLRSIEYFLFLKD